MVSDYHKILRESMNKVKMRLFVLEIICCWVVVLVASVFAGGYEWGGLGPRACGMGGAFIGVANDWTAPYWNPAGLTQTKGIGVGIELLQPNYKAKDGNSIANRDPAEMNIDQGDIFARIYPVEPTRFEKTEVSESFYHPCVGGFFDLKGIKIGAGFYVPVGDWFDWEDRITDPTNAEINASYFTSMWLMVGNLSLAKEIVPNLSLGVGLNILYLKSKYEAKKSYKNSTNPFFIDYEFKYLTEGSGTAFEGTFGVLYKPLPILSVGAVYRTGSEISLDGSGEYSHTLAPPAESIDYTQEFYHPATYGIGLACRPTTRFLLAFDWQRTDWSTWKSVMDFRIVGDRPRLRQMERTRNRIDWDWKVSNRYRFGGEYKLKEEIALRAGFYYDESPVPDEQVSFTNIADVDRKGITLGAGYGWKKFMFDFLYEYHWGEREVDEIEYNQKIRAYTLALSYQL